MNSGHTRLITLNPESVVALSWSESGPGQRGPDTSSCRWLGTPIADPGGVSHHICTFEIHFMKVHIHWLLTIFVYFLWRVLRIGHCAGDGPGSWGRVRLRVAASAGGQCAVRPRASHIRSIRDTRTLRQRTIEEAECGCQWHDDLTQALRGPALICSECQHNGCSRVKVTRYRGQESLPPLEFAIQHSYRKLENAESTPKNTGKAANCGNYTTDCPKLGLLLCDFEISTGSVWYFFINLRLCYVFTAIGLLLLQQQLMLKLILI